MTGRNTAADGRPQNWGGEVERSYIHGRDRNERKLLNRTVVRNDGH